MATTVFGSSKGNESLINTVHNWELIMAITQTRTWTRANTSTPFWVVNDITKDYIKKTFIDTGKILDLQRVEDATGLLSISLVTVFASIEAREDFQNDPTITEVANQRNIHNDYYNIIEELTVESD